jgi:hypothetical protein
MTVSITNSANGGGWFPYVLIKNGEVRREAILLDGDPVLGNVICNSLNYKSGNAVNFVISFAKEDHVTQAEGRVIAREFMQSFMHGFNEDEYHLDLVEHNDTDHLHYHARIPKVNLLTNTQLKLYWHKTDLTYKKAVIADVCNKYELVTGEEMKNTVPNPMHKLNQINKWREQHSQELLDLSSKKLRAVAEKQIGEYIGQMNTVGLINSLYDVKSEVINMGFDVVNEGYDRSSEFHYITIENESGKVRLKGDIYAEEFYRYSPEARAESISSNRSFTTRGQELRRSGADIKQTLQTERNKRLKFIKKQYGNARKRAIEREVKASLNTDREQERGGAIRLGEAYVKDKREAYKSTSDDIPRREAKLREDTEFEYRDNQNYGVSKKTTPKDERTHSHHSSLDAPHPSRRSSDRVVSAKANTTIKRDQPRGNEHMATAELHNTQDSRGLAINEEARRELNDSIRAEIDRTIREAAGSFYTRAKEDIYDVRREHHRSKERDREAVTDIKALRGRVHELADKHQSRTAKRIGKKAEREGAELNGRVEQSSREQSSISKSYGGLERELDRAVRSVRTKAGEHEQGRRGFAGAIKQCIEKAIEKVKEIVKKVERTYSRGFSP